MSYQVIAANQVTSLLQHPEIVVLDMRDSNAYVAGHIDHAIQATEEHVMRVIDEQDAESPVLVYCYHGISSQKMAEYLASQGLNHVFSLKGGWGAWCLYNP